MGIFNELLYEDKTRRYLCLFFYNRAIYKKSYKEIIRERLIWVLRKNLDENI